jgi:hypothetical protein
LIRTVLTYGCEAWKLSKKKQKTFWTPSKGKS